MDVELPEASSPRTKRIALCVAVYAVVLALAAAGGNNAGNDMILEQNKAANKWAHYQAKVIRESLYQNELDLLRIQQSGGMLAGKANELAEKKIAEIEAKLEEYRKEKPEIMAEARGHEAARDDAGMRDPYFDYGEVLLQIAIVLASVSMLSGNAWPFRLSIVLALFGLMLTVNGYTMLDNGKMMAAIGG